MPGFDGTGPAGNRQLGRGLGPCGRGMRMCFRKGLGAGQSAMYRMDKESEEKVLKAELEQIEEEKKAIEKRLGEMKE